MDILSKALENTEKQAFIKTRTKFLYFFIKTIDKVKNKI